MDVPRATPNKVDLLFRRLQLLSSGVFSLGHGGNDAQKTVGIIVLLLTAAAIPTGPESPGALPWLKHEYGLPSSSPATRHWPWAPCPADGAS